MSDPIATRPSHPNISAARRRWGMGAALAAAFVAGGLAFSGLGAVAQDAGMHAMMGGPRHAAMMAHMTAELDAIGATADQKSRIVTLLHTGLGPMMAAHGGTGDTHGELMRLLSAPTVDRAALEQLRAGEIARLDQASRTAVQALADAAEVLSPEQRAKLAAHVAEHRPPS